ncbi:hypothetical protein GCM10011338_31200 [Alteromonas lipolytica]|nr:hypothetical protein GCM10011338_31200 [Alteromonas lipolytica]
MLVWLTPADFISQAGKINFTDRIQVERYEAILVSNSGNNSVGRVCHSQFNKQRNGDAGGAVYCR